MEWAKSNQKVLGYFHNICAIIAPLYFSGRLLLEAPGFVDWLEFIKMKLYFDI